MYPHLGLDIDIHKYKSGENHNRHIDSKNSHSLVYTSGNQHSREYDKVIVVLDDKDLCKVICQLLVMTEYFRIRKSLDIMSLPNCLVPYLEVHRQNFIGEAKPAFKLL